MTNPSGEAPEGILPLDFDRRVMLHVRGSVVTSDAGLIAYRELDDALGLSELAGEHLGDERTGKNGRHALVGPLRQSVFGRLAGYEDVNDAERLRHDPAMRWIVGGKAAQARAASSSQMGRFETQWLAAPANLSALANLSGNWIDRARKGQLNHEIVLDMDSSVSPTHGEQEQSVWNGHFGFRGDAAFAMPGIYDFLESEGIDYAIRLPANQISQKEIAHLLKRPVGRPPHHVQRLYATFRYRAESWAKPRRVVAKVEWHPGELFPRLGFIVTNLLRRSKDVVAFYNKRGTAEQHIKGGKGSIKWTRLSCRTFIANAARLQLHALAYNLGNFMRTLGTAVAIRNWTLTSLREKLIKIGAKVVSHGRYVTFQMAEVAIPCDVFAELLQRIAALRSPPALALT